MRTALHTVITVLVTAVSALAQTAPTQTPAPDITGTWETSIGTSQGSSPATMTGTWNFEVTHSAGVSTPTITITQTGEKLAGKYSGSYGESELTGSITGADFTFTVEIGTEQKVKVVYTGTLTADTVKGNVSLGELGEGTFTGKRK